MIADPFTDQYNAWIQEWWERNRLLWGKLLQVKKATRVKCWNHGGHLCVLCDGSRFIDRDVAISHLEIEMEMAWQ